VAPFREGHLARAQDDQSCTSRFLSVRLGLPNPSHLLAYTLILMRSTRTLQDLSAKIFLTLKACLRVPSSSTRLFVRLQAWA
jgi:hypothetical protein